MVDNEFKVRLVEQWALLSDACKMFDLGVVRQIKAISSRLYSICHDMTRTPAWCDWSNGFSIKMLSTSYQPADLRNELCHHPLVGVSVGTISQRYLAKGNHIEKWQELRFSKWWNEVAIFLDRERRMTRQDIVVQMRNYGGGSHGFTEGGSEDYKYLEQSPSPSWNWLRDGLPELPDVSVLEATVRQIAHELLVSILPHCDENECKTIEYDGAKLGENAVPFDVIMVIGS